ncbi:tumor necrosis factor ligand superfamily member 18 isoform X3 [Oncorhynchus nerka]|uniref:tumor necrosis factor ligand superfamily member 18 isoform X3 n=1 Tax=Oncorhynchus nerka TaxID=8023 RepID=UPI0031B8A321
MGQVTCTDHSWDFLLPSIYHMGQVTCTDHSWDFLLPSIYHMGQVTCTDHSWDFLTKSIPLGPQRVPWQMLTFEPTSIDDNDASVARSGIKWKTQSKANHFVSLKGGSLTINQDGCYFLYLQVTLETPEVSGQHIVRVNKPNRVLLEVRMTNTSLSTGFLGRAVDLAASDTLTVTVSPGARINTTYTATYLGIIGPK